MFILVGLPVEGEISHLTEDQIEEMCGIPSSRIFLPSFTGVSLQGIMKQAEKLVSLERECDDLLKLFVCFSSKDEGDCVEKLFSFEATNARSLFEWDTENFAISPVDDMIFLLEKEYSKMDSVYDEKTKILDKTRTDYDEFQRLARGNLCDIDLSILVDNLEKYEFLRVLYVVVQKEKIEVFEDFVKDSPCISDDAVERIGCDEEYILFKLYVLHNDEEKTKKEISAAGFILKKISETDTSVETITRRRSAEERYLRAEMDLKTFIHVYLAELLKITIHVKLLKLFIESVYRYGFPIEYVFFVSKGKRESLLRRWNSVTRDWPSSRIVCEEYGENDEPEIFFAFSEISSFCEDD